LVAYSVSAICLVSPVLLACQNWDDHDRSHRYTARDFAKNYLDSCEPNAILFTNGDNDTFPLWYVQEVEGYRTDVRVVNLAYINTDWYADQMKRRAYESAPLPISLTHDQYVAGTRDLVYYSKQDALLVNEKFEANAEFKPVYEQLYNSLVNILSNSDFKTKHQADYEAIVNRQVGQFSKFAALVNTLNTNPQQYGINSDAIKQLKTSTDALLRQVCDAHAPLKSVISFIADDSDYSKLTSQGGEKTDFAPTFKFLLPVDKKKVIENGTVPAEDSALIVDAVKWTHPGNYIRKGQLMVLDILAQNNWERPVYFAITVGSESYQNLDAYFRLDGFTYRVVPIKTTSDNGDKGSINSDILYKNVMEKFQWGGINDPRVYLDENNLRMLMNVKNNFLRLASKLIDQRKTDKARQVLAKCYEVMPFECVAPSFYDIFLADLYYRMGDNDKAREIIDVVVNQTCQELVYFNSLSEEQVATVQEDRYRAAAFSHEIVRIMSENHDTENARAYAKKFADIIATFPEIVKFESMDMNSPAFGQWYQTLPQNRQQVIAIYLYLIDPNQL
ncbi:MAG: hypothetical protein IKB95_03570, partial [Bacteroidales bacterium]|nr:hypothetical protein [Bacteroidales bacterium]